MALTGRTVVLVLLGLVPLAVWPTLATVGWWWLVVAAAVGVDLAGATPLRALAIERPSVGQVRLGEQTSSSLLVTNQGRRRFRGVLRDAWQPSAGARDNRHAVRLDGGERTRLTTTLCPTRRGDRQADLVTVRSLGPLGLAARQASRAVPGSVRALPPFTSRKHLPSRLARLRQLDGRSAVRIRGQGTEFDSLRDYVDGDDVRSIDWRATARRRSVVVRTWQPERDRRIILLLDTSRTSAARVLDMPRLDAELDAALLLAALASRAGDRVDLLAGDRRVRAKVSGSGNRTDLLHGLVTAMAPLEPALLEANWVALAGAVGRLSRRRALVVLLTSLEPAAVEEGLLPVLPSLTAHHRVVLASVADPTVVAMTTERSNVEAVYDAAAATRTLALRRRTAEACARLGVEVLDAPPEELPAALADHYLELKSRGLL